jgi:hypothetical protein
MPPPRRAARRSARERLRGRARRLRQLGSDGLSRPKVPVRSAECPGLAFEVHARERRLRLSRPALGSKRRRGRMAWWPDIRVERQDGRDGPAVRWTCPGGGDPRLQGIHAARWPTTGDLGKPEARSAHVRGVHASSRSADLPRPDVHRWWAVTQPRARPKSKLSSFSTGRPGLRAAQALAATLP